MAGKNYAAGQPVGNNQMLFNIATPAPFKAIARYYTENGVTSSVITLSQNTTAIEIASGKSAVIMKWVAVTEVSTAGTSVLSSNYDHVIPEGEVRRFVVPIEVNNPQGYGSFVGANIENGLFRRVAYANTSIGSVFATEYGSSNSY